MISLNLFKILFVFGSYNKDVGKSTNLILGDSDHQNQGKCFKSVRNFTSNFVKLADSHPHYFKALVSCRFLKILSLYSLNVKKDSQFPSLKKLGLKSHSEFLFLFLAYIP